MDQYLLLRDNKQSGPFSLDELVAAGLKAYDLVWKEGKSAAWRYPSEFPELKDFSPAVEEQPFDRFFRKPSDAGQESNHPVLQERGSNDRTPSISQPEKSESHIFVTLPNGNGARIRKAVSQPVQAIQPQLEPVVAEEIIEKPSVKEIPVQQQTPAADFTYKAEEPLVRTAVRTNKNPRPKGVLIKAMAAVTLILGGIVIGMFYNNRRQQENIQQLNAVLQQMQDKSADNSTSNKKQEISHANYIPAIDASLPPGPVTQGDPLLPEANATEPPPAVKKPKNQKKSGSADSISERPDSLLAKITVPVEDVEPKKEVNKDQARRNLLQQVSLSGNKYKTGLLGGISGLELKLANNSSFELEKVEVTITYLSPEKKVVRTQTVYFENISPGEEMKMEIPKSSRGTSVDYAIKKINSRELGLTYAGM